MQPQQAIATRHLGPVSPGHRLEAWRVNALQRTHNQHRTNGQAYKHRYSGPFAGSPYASDSVLVLVGNYSFGNQTGAVADVTDGGEEVDLSAFGGEQTIYVSLVQRYGHATKHVFASSTTRPAEDRSNGIWAVTVIGVATMVSGVVVAWVQEQYGNIAVKKYIGPFTPALGAADLTTISFGGFIYHGDGIFSSNVSDTITPGNSKYGWAYWEISYNSSTGALIEDLKENANSSTPPTGDADKLYVVLGSFVTNASGEFTSWRQAHHGEIYAPRYSTYDPAASATLYTIGPDTPLILEATGSNQDPNASATPNFTFQKGAFLGAT